MTDSYGSKPVRSRDKETKSQASGDSGAYRMIVGAG